MRARSRYYALALAGTFTNIGHGEKKEHIRGQRIPNTWVISQCGYFVLRRNAPRSLAKSLYHADKLLQSHLFRASFLSFFRHGDRNEALAYVKQRRFLLLSLAFNATGRVSRRGWFRVARCKWSSWQTHDLWFERSLQREIEFSIDCEMVFSANDSPANISSRSCR